MCGFVGFVNFKKNINDCSSLIKEMNKTLNKRGPDEEGYYISNHILMGHRRLVVIDPERRKTTNDRKL